jgi:hypothetical protein
MIESLPKYPTADRPHLSASRIESFLGCRYQWKLERVDKVKVKRSMRFAFGTSMHYMAEQNSLHKIATGEDMPFEKCWAIFVAKFEEEWKGAFTRDLAKEFGDIGAAKDGFLLHGALAARHFVEDIAPRLNPLHAELDITVPLTGMFDLRGKIDVVNADNGNVVIVDFKFGKTNRVNEHDWLAGDIYAAGWAVHNGGELPDFVQLIKSYRGKKRGKVVEFSEQVKPTQQRITEAIETADMVVRLVADGQFQPTGLLSPYKWRCNYCDFIDVCKFAQGEEEVDIIELARVAQATADEAKAA